MTASTVGSTPRSGTTRRTPSRWQALCCECGTVREVTVQGAVSESVIGVGPRCLVQRDCVTCAARTTHAYLRRGADRDIAERRQQVQSANLTAQINELLNEMVAVGARIEFEPEADKPGVGLWRWLDDGKFEVTLEGAISPRRLVRILKRVHTYVLHPDDIHSWAVYPETDTTAARVGAFWNAQDIDTESGR